MFKLFLTIFRIQLFLLTKSQRDILVRITTIEKENEILHRRLKLLKKKVILKNKNRKQLAILSKLSDKFKIRIVQPETILEWFRNLIKKRWTNTPSKKKPGRPNTPEHIKKKVLEMKNDNIFWGGLIRTL